MPKVGAHNLFKTFYRVTIIELDLLASAVSSDFNISANALLGVNGVVTRAGGRLFLKIGESILRQEGSKRPG